MGKLYVIATPIGNRNDLTLRAVSSMRAIDIYFAEDTRELEKLLMLHGIETGGKRLYSYGKHNMKAATEKALQLLAEGRDVGLVTDRGTPAISDPGSELVRAARNQGDDIVVLPGASSVTAAFSASGIADPRFIFAGFLPDTNKARAELWDKARTLEMPVVFLESPQRVRATAQELISAFPAGTLFVAREMTKMHESFTSFPLAELDPVCLPEMGEYVLILVPGERTSAERGDLEVEVSLRLASEKEWSKKIGDRLGLTHSDVYNALQKRKRESAAT